MNMKRLFVAMPYGIRKAPLDFEAPGKLSTIDFDAVWEGILKPSLPPDFEAKRADELRPTGLIDPKYIEWLFNADIVLADLTFGNANVYYELGIRQALIKNGTVLIACKGTRLPFDVRNQSFIDYDYFSAPSVQAFQERLREAIKSASAQEEVLSPIHIFLPGLSVKRYQRDEKTPEAKIQELTQRIVELKVALTNQRSQDEEERFREKLRAASSAPRVLALYKQIVTRSIKSVRLLETLAVSLRSASCFNEALEVLMRALEMSPEDPDLLREIGFVYRKKGQEFYPKAEEYMQRALDMNDQDFELQGMLGGLLRRRGEYEQALARYKKAHELQPDELYPLVTVGAMSGVLGRTAEAKEWYQKLKIACEKLINQDHADHWTYLCLGEAAAVLGNLDAAEIAYQNALASNPPVEHVRSETEQLEFLLEKNFAADSVRSVLPLLWQYLTIHDPK
jgi:tetratricopeptide (TPR) repeat protein